MKPDFQLIKVFCVVIVTINFVLNKILNWFSMPLVMDCISATKQGPVYYRRCWCEFFHNVKLPFTNVKPLHWRFSGDGSVSKMAVVASSALVLDSTSAYCTFTHMLFLSLHGESCRRAGSHMRSARKWRRRLKKFFFCQNDNILERILSF